jgi:hypothetical protein
VNVSRYAHQGEVTGGQSCHQQSGDKVILIALLPVLQKSDAGIERTETPDLPPEFGSFLTPNQNRRNTRCEPEISVSIGFDKYGFPQFFYDFRPFLDLCNKMGWVCVLIG